MVVWREQGVCGPFYRRGKGGGRAGQGQDEGGMAGEGQTGVMTSGNSKRCRWRRVARRRWRGRAAGAHAAREERVFGKLGV